MSDQSVPLPRRLLTRGSWPEAKRLAEILRMETVGGVLLLVAATAAIAWANSPWSDAYRAVSDFAIGPQSWHLRLSVAEWAADGLLAIFFFVVGLELKREFVAGDLRDPARAALPIAAAVGGMVVPAAIFIAINLGTGHQENVDGWAVPVATDIAFALAVLAVLSTHLPSALRTFLLTLAVVDDLMAITIIAAFFTEELSPGRWCSRWSRWRCSGWPCSAATSRGGFCCHWPRQRGRWCTRAACMPPSPGYCWVSSSPFPAQRDQAHRGALGAPMRPVSAGLW